MTDTIKNENETEVKEVKTEIKPISIICHPNYKGNRVTSAKYGKIDSKTKVRFDCSIPVPSNDEEAEELYNISIAKLIEKGTRQHMYDENVTNNLIKENIERLETVEFTNELQTELETALFTTKKERKTGVAKETKKLAEKIKTMYATYGLDPEKNTEEELIEAIQKG